MNLVGPGPLDGHYMDCSEALLGLNPEGRWADLGTGAGFPGIVFAAMFPEVQLELVDSRRKRCVFLREVLDRAHRSDIEVRCMRVESLPDGVYDGVVSRAFAPPDRVLVHAQRLLRPGGRLVMFLQASAELDAEAFETIRRRDYQVDGRALQSLWLQAR